MSRTIRDQSPPGAIELDALAAPTTRERTRRLMQAHADAFAALPAGQRASFTMNGVQIQIVSAPSLLRDESGAVIGIRMQARAQGANGPLPQGDGWHHAHGLPIKVHDGSFHRAAILGGDGSSTQADIPNYVENPVAMLKLWLYNSVVATARTYGWIG